MGGGGLPAAGGFAFAVGGMVGPPGGGGSEPFGTFSQVEIASEGLGGGTTTPELFFAVFGIFGCAGDAGLLLRFEPPLGGGGTTTGSVMSTGEAAHASSPVLRLAPLLQVQGGGGGAK